MAYTQACTGIQSARHVYACKMLSKTVSLQPTADMSFDNSDWWQVLQGTTFTVAVLQELCALISCQHTLFFQEEMEYKMFFWYLVFEHQLETA